MTVLITGGAGFIGSNFVHYYLAEHPEEEIVNLDALTYAGNEANLKDIADQKNYHFVKGSIADSDLVDELFKQYQFDIVVNFAAESHVDRSILNPEIFVETNVLGTTTLLNASKKYGVKRYLQVSTDEVYGSLKEEGYFTEKTALAPNSPYSASKASADLLVMAYHRTFGLPVNITRCSNNYGPYQFPEKLIPLMIGQVMDGLELPVYGTGKNVRDWLHVLDHCRAIDLVLRKGRVGEIYNVGGHNERSNNQIVETIVKQMNYSKDKITYVKDRLGHDFRYAIDPTKLVEELGFKPLYTFDTGIKETINWYLENEDWWRPLQKRAKLKRLEDKS
ncbi:dTDP-glucose 4,6-dehydratase [Atopobacter sp. AH10]|uniref:dTDP-glucose 4,6-dehydratase n=1 Tax=Atopobacter sp. AH10 TaxID=2315861 RepID=UPI000EF19E32|nr:dTDP-glucose 4,6-dehydratase [Atopobacter sp. AH10]RLK63648.1 dTDP-glucose 4,6-dehydratase [Atopobacter sp. AH10]